MNVIEITPQSDRELLILTAQAVNQAAVAARTATEAIKSTVDHIDKKLEDIDDNLDNKVDKKFVYGVFAAVGVVVSGVVAYVLKHIGFPLSPSN